MEKYQKYLPLVLKKGLEDIAAARREQVLLQTELKRFTKLPNDVVSRGLLQMEFEQLLKEKSSSGEDVNLDAWCWVESFDNTAMTQVSALSFCNFCQIAHRSIGLAKS
jgi:hypothetical protein